MPVPIPSDVLLAIKAEKGLSEQEQMWSFAAVGVAAIALFLTYVSQSPMPLVAGFAFTALVVAGLEVDDA